MDIFVVNAADKADVMLEKILSTLDKKNFSCSFKVFSDGMQIVAKKMYASKIKIFTVGKNLNFEVSPENFVPRKVKSFINSVIARTICIDPYPTGSMFDLNSIEVQEIVSIIQECLKNEGLNCHIGQ